MTAAIIAAIAVAFAACVIVASSFSTTGDWSLTAAPRWGLLSESDRAIIDVPASSTSCDIACCAACMYGARKALEALSIVAKSAPISGATLCISPTIMNLDEDIRLSAAVAVDSTTCKVVASSFSTCRSADGGCSDIERTVPRGVTTGRKSATLADMTRSMAPWIGRTT